MHRVGVVGLGDMGSGLAKNLLAKGYSTIGLDLEKRRMDALAAMGGSPATTLADVGENADAVFVMVMNGRQAHEVVLGPGGLAEKSRPAVGDHPYGDHHAVRGARHRRGTRRNRH